MKSRYPNYDVMNYQLDWDDHTRSIVRSRLEGTPSYSSLSLVEAEMLRAICSILAGDGRSNIIQYVLLHIDQTLSAPKGEGQRKAGLPSAGELLHGGLKRLEMWCMFRFQRSFIDLSESEQFPIVSGLSEGSLPFPQEWNFPQKAFFNRLLGWTVESYYSHPTVWSEIGYAGPAYPKGYIRANIGQLEPREAKPEP